MHNTMPPHAINAPFKPAASAWRGVAAVVALHVLLFAALYSGLGAKFLKIAPVVVVAQLTAVPELQPPPEPSVVQPVKPPVKVPVTVPALQPVVPPTVQPMPEVPVLVPAPVPASASATAEQKQVAPVVTSPATATAPPLAVALVREPERKGGDVQLEETLQRAAGDGRRLRTAVFAAARKGRVAVGQPRAAPGQRLLPCAGRRQVRGGRAAAAAL